MTKLGAWMADVADASEVYSIGPDGIITRLTVEQYESLPIDDPMLDRIAWYWGTARAIALRVLGVATVEPKPTN